VSSDDLAHVLSSCVDYITCLYLEVKAKEMSTTSDGGGPMYCIQATGRSAEKTSKFVDVSSPLQAVRQEGAEDACYFHALKTVKSISP
jgi:hypothetical protein